MEYRHSPATSVKGGPDLPKQAKRVTAPFHGGPDQPYVSTRLHCVGGGGGAAGMDIPTPPNDEMMMANSAGHFCPIFTTFDA